MALVMEKIVTSRFGDAEAGRLGRYETTEGYQAIRRILGKVEPAEVIEIVKDFGSSRPGRGGISLRPEVELRPPDRRSQVSRRKCRRGRAGHLQGP